MKSRTIFLGVVGLGLILSILTICHATSLKTKMFQKDLQKCEQFIGKQYDVLMEFLNALTEEDVAAINVGTAKHQDVEIFNSKAVSAFKKLRKTSKTGGRDYPEGVKSRNMPRNFLNGKIQFVSYYKAIIADYQIPIDGYDEFFNSYSEYVINLLDKLQELRNKVDNIGLTIYALPTLNGVYVGTGSPLVFLTAKNDVSPLSESFRNGVYDHWKWSVKEILELYSNKSVLTAQKLWLEFLMSNDFTSSKWGDSYDEEYMTELDKIEKRLAKLSGAPVQKQEAAQKPTDARPESAKPAPAPKSKFKLDLPE